MRRALAFAVLLGCGEPRAPAVAAPPPAPRAPEALLPAPAPHPPVSKSDGTLRLAAFRDQPLTLAPMQDDVVLVIGGSIAEGAPGQHLSERPGVTARVERQLADPFWEVKAMGGRWPDDAWMTLETETWRTGLVNNEIFHHDADGWHVVDNAAGLLQWHHVGYAQWTGDQWLALRDWSLGMDAQVAAHDDLGAPSPELSAKHMAAYAAVRPEFIALAPSPAASPPPSLAFLRDEPPHARFSPWLFTARDTGEIDLLIARLDEGTALLRWLPGAREPRRFPLPALHGQAPNPHLDATFAAHRDGGLWFAADSPANYLARFDGERWTLRDPPGDAQLRWFTVGRDGTLWAITGEDSLGQSMVDLDSVHLWRSPDGDEWTVVPLPSLRFADMATPRQEFVPALNASIAIYGDAADAQVEYRVQPKQAWSDAAGEVWVIGVTVAKPPALEQARARLSMRDAVGLVWLQREVLLRSGPVGAPLHLPDELVVAQRLAVRQEGPK